MNKITFMRKGRPVTLGHSGNRFMPIDEKTRFLSKIKKRHGCWVWTDALDKDGYGKFQTADNRTERAHRTAWRLYRGKIPKGKLCLHACDNPSCVNPGHLFLGTQKDNIQDMIKKGRRARPNAKITVGTARRIKRMLSKDGASGTAIARRLGVSKVTVFAIKYGETWKDV